MNAGFEIEIYKFPSYSLFSELSKNILKGKTESITFKMSQPAPKIILT